MSSTMEVRPLRVREFDLLRAFIRAESGIELSSKKRALVESRLKRRLRLLGLHSFHEYYCRLLDDDGSERQRMLDCITTNETSFFREEAHFKFLERSLVPNWKREAESNPRRKHIRVWSAGCSTGEEPYSIGMCLLDALPRIEGWSVEIIASDISIEVLQRASLGVFSLDQAKGIPPKLQQRFMLRGRGTQRSRMKVGNELRSSVRFGRFNLNSPRYAFRQPFDLILCRNVLIYFGRDEKMRVVHRLLDLLVSDGILMLGHAESLQGQTERVRCLRPTIYALSESAMFSTDNAKPESAP